MPQAWRIVKAVHESSAFSGEGAAKFGGRWNSRFVPVVYASHTLSLAALEALVHLIPPFTFRYVAVRIEFDDDLVESVSMKTLPADWRAEPPSSSTRLIGDAWVAAARSPILAVPSILIPVETNYVINPAHPEFKRLSIAKAQPFAFDSRLIKG